MRPYVQPFESEELPRQQPFSRQVKVVAHRA